MLCKEEGSLPVSLQLLRGGIPSKQWGKKPLHLVCILPPFSPSSDILNGYVTNTEANIHVALSSHRNSHLYITFFHVL